MKRTTKKLSGPALNRFLRRFVSDEPGLSPEAAAHLAERLGLVLSSVRVRAMPWPRQRLRKRADTALSACQRPATERASPPAATGPATPPQPTPVAAVAPPVAFDAYAIGLVPTLQREGRDGLLAKLSAVASIDDLRKMARAQQISLPEALRQGDVTAEVLRSAIADAVAKRIADRRAAAG